MIFELHHIVLKFKVNTSFKENDYKIVIEFFGIDFYTKLVMNQEKMDIFISRVSMLFFM